MTEDPTSTPREDPPTSGPSPEVQASGDSSCVSVTEGCITYNIEDLAAGPWITLSEWDIFPPGDPSQPIPADDEQPELTHISEVIARAPWLRFFVVRHEDQNAESAG